MVRKKQVWKNIIVTENIYNRIEEDRKVFEKTINGGKWSMNDSLREWIKVLDIVKEEKLFEK